MTTSWFPDPPSNQISSFSLLMLGFSFSLLWILIGNFQAGKSPSEAEPQGLFESLPPQILDFSLGGGSY
ncbi:MAG: hypothetical protein ACO31I_18575 [Prochlorotrichaceae cyanobacterium]|jgi:hypothetical protein